MKRQLLAAALGLALLAPGASAQTLDKPAPPEAPVPLARHGFVIEPGEVEHWQSPRIGSVGRIALNAGPRDGGGFWYLVPRANNCVGYAFDYGVVVRFTDCVKGRRVPYVRMRAVSGALNPVRVRFSLWRR